MYFRLISEGFLSLGCRVAVFCSEPCLEEMRAYARGKENVSVDLCQRFQVRRRLPSIIQGRDHAWRTFGGLETRFKRWEKQHGKKIDLVFFQTIYDPQFENMFLAHRLFRRPWSSIYLHARCFRMPSSPIPYSNKLPCPEKIFTHPSLSSVCLLDEGAVAPMRKLIGDKPAFEFPDITDTDIDESIDGENLSGKLLRFANGRSIVVCIGHLQKTKGLVELCKVANDPRMADICFFFGGEVLWTDLSQNEVQYIRSTWENAPNVLTHLARIRSDATLNALIQASNVVFAAYSNFPNSSNMMTKAAMLERSIIVSDNYLMAERVRKYGLGSIVPEGSVEDMIIQIRHLCDQGCNLKADYKNYYAKHSAEALSKALEKVIEAIPHR